MAAAAYDLIVMGAGPGGYVAAIGAGYIGLALWSVWRRLGVQITLLEYLDRILFGVDAELAAEARKVLQKQGLEFRLGCKITGAWVHEDRCVGGIEGQEPLPCDRVLVAVGRAPNTQHLGVESVGSELHAKGSIPVNERFAALFRRQQRNPGARLPCPPDPRRGVARDGAGGRRPQPPHLKVKSGLGPRFLTGLNALQVVQNLVLTPTLAANRMRARTKSEL
jgi:hypothetical protein